MKHKGLFIATAIVLMIFGLVWFLIPNIGLKLWGHDLQASDLPSTLTRYWGSAFIAVALITWLARNGQADSIGVRAIVWGGFALSVTGLAASIMDKVFDVANNMVWLNILLYGTFAVLYGILAFKKPA